MERIEEADVEAREGTDGVDPACPCGKSLEEMVPGEVIRDHFSHFFRSFVRVEG